MRTKPVGRVQPAHVAYSVPRLDRVDKAFCVGNQDTLPVTALFVLAGSGRKGAPCQRTGIFPKAVKQPAPYNSYSSEFMVGGHGLEPWTSCL